MRGTDNGSQLTVKTACTTETHAACYHFLATRAPGLPATTSARCPYVQWFLVVFIFQFSGYLDDNASRYQ